MSNRSPQPAQGLFPAIFAAVLLILIFGFAVIWQMLDVAKQAAVNTPAETGETAHATEDRSLTASPVVFASDAPPAIRSLNGTITNIDGTTLTLQTLAGETVAVSLEGAAVTRKKMRFASPVLKYGDGTSAVASASLEDLSVRQNIVVQTEEDVTARKTVQARTIIILE